MPQATRARPRASRSASKPIVTPADIQEVERWLATEVVVERDHELKVIRRALLSGTNVNLLGPPGTAKSLLVREYSNCIVGARYFEKNVNAGMPPDAVIGPYDMERFGRTGEFVRKVDGYAPTAHVLFIDEWGRANGLMGDALLPILNPEERMAEHNGGMMKCPTLFAGMATNFMPDEDNEQAKALVSRITLMLLVERVKSDESFKELIRRHHERRQQLRSGRETRKTITLEQAQAAQAEVDAVVPSAEYLEKLAKLRRSCDKEGLTVDDRAWAMLGRVARADAWYAGRDILVPEDLAAVEDGLWRSKDERAIAHKLCLEFRGQFEKEAEKFRGEAAKAISQLDEIRADVENTPPTEQLAPSILTKAISASRAIANVKERIGKVIEQAVNEKRDPGPLRDLSNQLHAQQLWLKRYKLPHNMD